MTGIPRLTAAERKAFAAHAREFTNTPPEPACGTLEQRLDILIRRFGGNPGRVHLTDDEQIQFERAKVRP